VHFDNATTVGIANNTVKWQQSRSMEMRYFGVGNKSAQDAYEIKWHPEQENLADYQSKLLEEEVPTELKVLLTLTGTLR
jgi:hypothetical protein